MRGIIAVLVPLFKLAFIFFILIVAIQSWIKHKSYTFTDEAVAKITQKYAGKTDLIESLYNYTVGVQSESFLNKINQVNCNQIDLHLSVLILQQKE